ncbi:MAG: helix-turn-helix domain-containing protein [Catenulispora sp.]|nr:helix-turn-helix domain-containing protein [Catenulispora sp.]
MGHADQADSGARALAARMLERTEEVADAVTARINALIPAYAERVPAAGLRRSVAEHYRVVFRGLLDPTLDGDAPADLAGRSRAAEGVPMSAVFEAYQIFLSFIWQHLAEAADRDEVPARTAVHAASELWRRLSGFTDVMSDSYRCELEARIRSHEQRRSALVQALLEGHLSEPELWEAADVLRLPHSGPYVVIAARVAGAGEHGVAGIEDGLRDLSITSAWRLQHDVEIGVASLTRAPDQLDQLVAALTGGSAGRVGVSPLFDDLTGTAQALKLARIALRGSSGTGKVVVFGRDSLSVAAASAPDVMSRLSRAILSGLEPMAPEDRAVLLDTFGAWLNHGGSADEAARLLFVHPNTVRYRLRRLEERTGRTLSDPRHVAELSLAFEVDRGRVAASGEAQRAGPQRRVEPPRRVPGL